MRPRRHGNGTSNSNALTNTVKRSASSSQEFGRTGSQCTVSSKQVPPRMVDASGVAANAQLVKNDNQEKGNEAAKISLFTSCSLRDNKSRQKRRVQSAPVASRNRLPLSSLASEETLFDTALQSSNDDTLPELQSFVGDLAGAQKRECQVSRSVRKPNIVDLSLIPSKTKHIDSQIRWAENKSSTSPVDVSAGSSEPIGMRDLRSFLHDRYGDKRSVRQAFLSWDRDRDGCLCAEEIRGMLTQLGINQVFGPKKVDSILAYVQALPTRSLRYDDFHRFVCNSPDRNDPAADNHFCSLSSKIQAIENEKPEEDRITALDSDCVVSLLRTKYESRRLDKVFRAWDIDKDGGITMAEIEKNLRRQGLRIVKSSLEKLFDTFDVDHDGRLQYHEFMRLMYGPVREQRYSYLAEQRRKNQNKYLMHEEDPLDFIRRSIVSEQSSRSTDDPSFHAKLQCKLKSFAPRLDDAVVALNGNRDGFLSYRDLYDGLQDLGLELTKHEFHHLAARVGSHGDGNISSKEFCDALRDAQVGSRRHDKDSDDPSHEEPELQPKDSFCRGDSKALVFSTLTRRTEIPTRRGRTVYPDTKRLLGFQDSSTNAAQFRTEAQSYGHRSSSHTFPPTQVMMTLGQEEKQRHAAAIAVRLQRLHIQMERYEAQAKQVKSIENLAQERRVRTLQRHRERYHQRIKGQQAFCQHGVVSRSFV